MCNNLQIRNNQSQINLFQLNINMIHHELKTIVRGYSKISLFLTVFRPLQLFKWDLLNDSIDFPVKITTIDLQVNPEFLSRNQVSHDKNFPNMIFGQSRLQNFRAFITFCHFYFHSMIRYLTPSGIAFG